MPITPDIQRYPPPPAKATWTFPSVVQHGYYTVERFSDEDTFTIRASGNAVRICAADVPAIVEALAAAAAWTGEDP